MKIALCIEYPIDQPGGTEVLVSELIRGFGRKHHIVLVSPDSAETLAASPTRPFVAEHISFSIKQWTPATAKELAQRIAAAKVDLAHFHFGGNYGWGNRAFRNCPVVYVKRLGLSCLSTNHGAFSILEGYCWNARPLWVKLALFLPAWFSKQYVLAHLACEVAVSQHDFHALRRWYGFMRNKFRWIYHSRLQDKPPPPPATRRKTILCAGTIGPRKGQTYLVEAFVRVAAKFPDWTLVLIGRTGDEDMMQHIEQLIRTHALGSQVLLLGKRSDDELNQWFRETAIFAMPSLYEGLGLSLQEAQFYGCACVAYAAGGVQDLVQNNGNGLLLPVGDVPALATALERLMQDEPLRHKFAVRGPQSVLEKGMTAPQMVAAYESLYAKVLKKAA